MRNPRGFFLRQSPGFFFILIVGLLLAACDETATATVEPRPIGSTPTVVQPSSTPEEIQSTPTPEDTLEPTDDYAKILAQSQVRRLTPVVMAGLQAPLSELINDMVVDLQPGGMVSTDQSGEAEVIIEDCLKIFLYQGSELMRNTCRQSDYESGLAVCATAGMVSVVNDCLAQVVIVQTPNSEIVTTGTEFTVMYVPEEEVTVVQVLEGTVVFTPLLLNIPAAQPPVEVNANEMIYTRSLQIPTSGNALPERQVLPLEDWGVLRSNLAVKSAYVDQWMESSRLIAVDQSLTFSQQLVRPTGIVNLEMRGSAWSDSTMQTLVTDTIPWLELIHTVWPEAFVKPKLIFPKREVDDARFFKVDREKLAVLSAAGAVPYPIELIANRNDTQSVAFAENLNEYLLSSGVESSIQLVGSTSFGILRENATRTSSNAGIFITVSGDYFE
ncbi:MAG TPA: hypothetical protein VIO36_04735 [Anaerolineaceae bacterium]